MKWNSPQNGQWMTLLPCMYAMHELFKDTSVPLVYCLMRSKTKEKQEDHFEALKNLNATLDPHEVTIEFENTAIGSVKSSFPKANMKGCFFHFVNTTSREIQSVGLAVEYQQNTYLRNILNSFVALALIPEEDIYFGFCNPRKQQRRCKKNKLQSL